MGAFVVTASHVVWADQTADQLDPTLHAQPLGGGPSTALAFDASFPLFSLAATDTAAFPMMVDASTVSSVPLHASQPTALASNADLTGLLLVCSDVYFSNSFSGDPPNTLLRVPAAGGNVETSPTSATRVEVPCLRTAGTCTSPPTLNQVKSFQVWPLAGGAVTTVYSSSSATDVFTSSNGRLYFMGQSPCADDGGETYAAWEIGADKSNMHVDEDGLERPVAMAADSTYVYVVTQEGAIGASHIRRFSQ